MAQGRPASPNPRHRVKQPTAELSGSPEPADTPELLNADQYCPATLAWWDNWCDSDQAEIFTSTDWFRLMMLAQVVDEFFLGDTTKMAEIRLNEEKLGATVRDRQNLRMTTKPTKAKDDKGTDNEPQDADNVVRLKTAFGKSA